MSSDRRLSPALIQWILAAALLLFGLVSLPAFAGFLFILAAILAAPIRPLRDLLSGVGVKSWMIGALAVILAILGFVFFPARSSADADTDARAAVTSAATTTAKATTVKTTTAKTTTAKATTTKATTAKATTAKATTTTPAATTTTTAAATTTTKATRAYHAPSNSPNVIEEGGTNQCYRNEIVTCKFWGDPDTVYDIDVHYSTKVSEADGLENHTSDADGYVEWTWKIGGNTTEGRRYLIIKGGVETVRIEFDVLES